MLSVLWCNTNVRVLPILVGVNHEGDSLLVDLASLHPVLVLSYIDLIAKLIVYHLSLHLFSMIPNGFYYRCLHTSPMLC